MRVVLRVPLHAERKAWRIGNSNCFDGAVVRHALDDDAFAGLENALAMERVHPDGFLTKKPREGAARGETNIMTVAEDDVVIRMDFARLQSRHPMVHAPGQFADLGVQRAAERYIHLLKAAADAEQRHAASDADLDQCQCQCVTPQVVRLMLRMRFDAEPAGMHIGATARQQHAVNNRRAARRSP